MDPKKINILHASKSLKLNCERITVYKSHRWHYSHKNEMVSWYIAFVQAWGPAITRAQGKTAPKVTIYPHIIKHVS